VTVVVIATVGIVVWRSGGSTAPPEVAPVGPSIPVGVAVLPNGDLAVLLSYKAFTGPIEVRILQGPDFTHDRAKVFGRTLAGLAGVDARGLAVDGDGNLYVGTYQSSQVAKVAPDGKITDALAGERRDGRHLDDTQVLDLAGGQAGNFYLAGTRSRSGLSMVGPDGRFGAIPDSSEQTDREIIGVATGPEGVLYAADAANHQVVRFAADGQATVVLGTGTAATERNLPMTSTPVPGTSIALSIEPPTRPPMAVGPDGTLYYSDGSIVDALTPDGTVRTVATLDDPNRRHDIWDLAVDAGGNLYIADARNNQVRRLNPKGELSTVLSTA
jgi:sugar lactone lactonase YvrE